MIGGCIRLAMLLLSFFGYWEYFRANHKINVYCAPVFTIAVQFVILLAAGILNCLEVAVIAVYSVGFLLLLSMFRKEKWGILAPYWNLGYLYYAMSFVAVGAAVFGKEFTQIDNFTHWATVVKTMLSTDRFPSFMDTAIEFTSYPLGSSAMIYYFCRLTDDAEYIMMLAQAFFVISAILPLFACCKKNSVPYTVLVAVMTGFLLCYNVPLTELLVDTLMPVAGMATVVFIYIHYVSNRNEEYSLSYALPLLLWTMNIKHAAMIYTAFALLILFLAVRKRKAAGKQCLYLCGAVVLAKVLWSRHCDYVFGDVSLSKHALSLRWFRMILDSKSKESILNTVKITLEGALQRTEYLWLGLWLLLLGLLVWRLLGEKRKLAGTCFAGMAVLYAVYTVGVTAMYVFSMPEHEIMASFSRYMRTMDIAVYYMLTAFAGIVLQQQKTRIAAAVMVLLACATWRWQTGEYAADAFSFSATEEFRQEMEAPIKQHSIETRRSYLLCLGEEYTYWYDFPRYLWQYHMESGAVTQRIITERAQLADADAFDYVIVLDEGNPVIEEWIQENHPEAVGSTAFCRYE